VTLIRVPRANGTGTGHDSLEPSVFYLFSSFDIRLASYDIQDPSRMPNARKCRIISTTRRPSALQGLEAIHRT